MNGIKGIAVTLLSGGLDSTVATAWARSRGFDVFPLTIHYGQAHRREIQAAEEIAQGYGLRWKMVEVPALADLASHSALTNSSHDVPLNRSVEAMTDGVPISYVPMRNSMFLAMAAAYLESLALPLIEQGERPDQIAIVIGANAVDYSGYPDCRDAYLDRMVQALNAGSKVWTEYQLGFDILRPLVQLTKREIVRLGIDLAAPLERSYSCYRGGETPCAECDSCQIRHAALEAEGLSWSATTGESWSA